jgi:DNA-binding GntR family transcriptional regulator
VPVDYDSDTPPYQQIADELRGRIERGELQPGQRLPSITQLSQEYGVARVTSVKALKVLADEGLIVSRPGWGNFVRREDR